MVIALTARSAASSLSVPKPILLANVALMLIGLAFLKFNLDRLFGLNLTDLGGLTLTASAGGAALVPILLPPRLRARALVRLRGALERPFMLTSCALICTLCALASAVSVYEVRWNGPDLLRVQVNGRTREILSRSTNSDKQIAKLYGVAGQNISVSANGFHITKRLPAIDSVSIDVPIYATSALTPRMIGFESKLILTFFHLFDRRELSTIKDSLSQVMPADESERIALDRLRRIRDIVDNGANSASDYDTKKILADNFAAGYVGDPWTPLLQAQALYGSQQFMACAEAVRGDLPRSVNKMFEAVEATRLFLRGMCSMKAVTTATGTIEQKTVRLQAAQVDMREGASRLAVAGISAELSDGARVSSMMYQAICLFYSGDMALAHDAFVEAAKALTTGQRARALNNAGFAAFVVGRLEDARDDYQQAYQADPTWLYITANIAYLDMAEGRIQNALVAFQAIAGDPIQKISSPEDARLAQIMLLELGHDRGDSLETVNRGYTRLLHEHRFATWDFVVDPDLRYAFLMHELANRVYLGGDYMGLEMFALAHVCKAGDRARTKPSSNERDTVLRLLERDRETLEGRVSAFWLTSPHAGLLAYLNGCSNLLAPTA